MSQITSPTHLLRQITCKSALLTSFYAIILFVVIKSLHVIIRTQLGSRKLKCQPASSSVYAFPMNVPTLIEMYRQSNAGRMMDFTVKLYEKYGNTFNFDLLGQRTIMTASANNIKTILATSFDDFELGKVRINNTHSLLGNGIFSVDGPLWHQSRALLKPQFVKSVVADLTGLAEKTDTMLALIKDNEEVEIQELFFRLSMDNATELLFGESADSLKEPFIGYTGKELLKAVNSGTNIGQPWNFSSAFGVAQFEIGNRFLFNELGWLYNPKDLRESTKYVHNFIDRYVRLALDHEEKKRSEKVETENKGGEHHHYVFLEGLAEQTQNPKFLRDQLVSILVAGRDTTATTLSWAIWLLSRHPEIYKTLRSTIPRDTPPTYQNIKDNSYLRSVLNEVLRLYPPVPVNSRSANKDSILPDGGGKDGKSPIFVLNGTRIFYSVFVLHRRKDIWGEDADIFNPDRWNVNPKPWQYVPFNGGPRICMGQQLALTTAGYVLSRLCQEFERIEPANPEVIEPEFMSTLVMSVGGSGVPVRLYRS